MHLKRPKKKVNPQKKKAPVQLLRHDLREDDEEQYEEPSDEDDQVRISRYMRSQGR